MKILRSIRILFTKRYKLMQDDLRDYRSLLHMHKVLSDKYWELMRANQDLLNRLSVYDSRYSYREWEDIVREAVEGKFGSPDGTRH